MCVSVALFINHEKCMFCVISSSVSCLAVPKFSALCRKRQEFRGKKKSIEHKHFSATFLILRRTKRDIIVNVQRSWYKVPVILVRF